jgi:hypothetical protein
MNASLQIRRVTIAGVLLGALFLGASDVHAQDGPRFEFYGFAMADAIVDFNQNNPDWYDTARPSRLPAFEDQFGQDGRFYLSARQSRLGARATIPIADHDEPLFATFEFDMFGVGRDAGLTTIRLRHAWGQYHEFGAGQTNSVFTDIDVFPNTLEYWGPNGMLFFRNLQVFWQPINDDGDRLTFSIENPGGSGDGGLVAERIAIEGVRARYPLPDFAAEYRYGDGDEDPWGYVELAGITRYFKIDDMAEGGLDLSEDEWGWGLSLSSNLHAGDDDLFRLGFAYGEGIQNYFNDAPVDVAAESQDDLDQPFAPRALPIFGMSAYLDHDWGYGWTSSIGYSRVDVDNSDLQTDEAFASGQYASANILWSPVEKALMGAEFIWTHRENNVNDFDDEGVDDDGFEVDDFRVQFSFKYNFSVTLGG